MGDVWKGKSHVKLILPVYICHPWVQGSPGDTCFTDKQWPDSGEAASGCPWPPLCAVLPLFSPVVSVELQVRQLEVLNMLKESHSCSFTGFPRQAPFKRCSTGEIDGQFRVSPTQLGKGTAVLQSKSEGLTAAFSGNMVSKGTEFAGVLPLLPSWLWLYSIQPATVRHQAVKSNGLGTHKKSLFYFHKVETR